MLTHAHLISILDYSPQTGSFTWIDCKSSRKLNGALAGAIDAKGYRYINILGKNYREHRLAWFYMKGVWPLNQIDHINRIRDDNRFENLREATNQENMRNASCPSHNTSGYVGVNWHKGDRRWRAFIKVNGKSIHLGNFTDKVDAIAARKEAEKLYKFSDTHGR